MDLSDKVQELLNNKKDVVDSSTELNRLKDFYERMKKEGLTSKQEYNIPPLDTIGRKFFESTSLYNTLDKL